MNITNTYNIKETETDSYTGWTINWKREIQIVEIDGVEGEQQIEKVYRNGQAVQSMMYPANTDYANSRINNIL